MMMPGSPPLFRSVFEPDAAKQRARERFDAAMVPVCAKRRLEARIRGEVCESPVADWPSKPGPTPGVTLATHIDLVKAEMGAVLVAMDALGVTAEAVRATAESRAVEYLGGAL